MTAPKRKLAPDEYLRYGEVRKRLMINGELLTDYVKRTGGDYSKIHATLFSNPRRKARQPPRLPKNRKTIIPDGYTEELLGIPRRKK